MPTISSADVASMNACVEVAVGGISVGVEVGGIGVGVAVGGISVGVAVGTSSVEVGLGGIVGGTDISVGGCGWHAVTIVKDRIVIAVSKKNIFIFSLHLNIRP